MTTGLSGKQVTYDYNNRPTNVVFAGQTTAYTYGPDGARQTKTVDGRLWSALFLEPRLK